MFFSALNKRGNRRETRERHNTRERARRETEGGQKGDRRETADGREIVVVL